jgi:hypothetical protein
MKERIEKVEKKLKEIETNIFLLDMKDRWNNDDFDLYDSLYDKKSELRKELDELRKELEICKRKSM